MAANSISETSIKPSGRRQRVDEFGRFRDPHETSKSANQFFPRYSVLPDIARSLFFVRATLSRGTNRAETFFLRRPMVTPSPPATLDHRPSGFYSTPRQCTKNAVTQNYRYQPLSTFARKTHETNATSQHFFLGDVTLRSVS